MRPRAVNVILRKELLETLRDKRTLIMMIAVPIILYPAMLLLVMQVALIQHSSLENTISKVAIQSPEPEMLRGWLQDLPRIEVKDSENPAQDLKDGKLDAIIVADCGVSGILNSDGTVPIEIEYDHTEFVSRDAVGRIQRVLFNVSERLRTERLERAGLPEEYIVPLKIDEKDVAPPEKTTGMLLGLLLPVLMIIMIALGAFYPAVDLTAGEKERGTFETLLATPTSKLEIVTGKFIAVFLLAMITGLLNLASMAATFLLLIKQLSSVVNVEMLGNMNLPFESFLIILVVMIPMAFFISAMMMSVAVFARSFKEAQNYLTPLLLVIMFPASIAGFPGIKLGAISRFVPIANVVLLFKELMTGKAGFEDALMVFISMGVYAMFALMLAAWLFQREDVVLSEQGGIPLSFRRRDFRVRENLTPGGAVVLYGLVMLFLFYAGSLLQQWRVITGLVITEWGLILLPVLLFLWFIRVRWKAALSIRSFSLGGLTGTLLIAFSSVILVVELGVLHNKVLPVPKSIEDALNNLFVQGNSPGQLIILLLVIALSPAVCEEVLFRGAILSGLRPRLGFWGSIAVIGVLFGFFHLSVYRIIPTGILGAVLTYIVLRTGSLIPGMIMHAIVNGASTLIATGHYPAVVDRMINLAEIQQKGLPLWLIVAGAAGFASGVATLEISHRKNRTPDS